MIEVSKDYRSTVLIDAGLASVKHFQYLYAGLGIGEGFVTIRDAIQEMAAFFTKRFSIGVLHWFEILFFEYGDFAFELNGLRIEQKFFSIGCDIIEDGHLFISHDHKALLLEGMQPTDENMSPRLIGKPHVRHGGVGQSFG